MKRWPIIAGILAYLIFCVVALEIYRKPVDEKLGQQAAGILAQAAVSDSSLEGAEISYRSMRGMLRGISDGATASRLRDEISQKLGRGSLGYEVARETAKKREEPVPQSEEPAVAVAAPRLPTFAMRPGSEPGTLVMCGELPNDDLIDNLVLGTRSEQPSIRWIDAENLRRAEVPEAEWFGGLPGFVNLLLSHTDGATLQFDASGLVVGGDVVETGSERRILEAAENLVGTGVVDRIRVPGTLEISRGADGMISIGGRLGSEADARVFSEALVREDAGAKVKIDAEVTSEVYFPEWVSEEAEALAKLVGNRPGGMVRIGAGKLLVGGGVAGEEERLGVLEMAGETAGELLEVESELKVLEAPRLTVVKIGDEITLQGLLPAGEIAGQIAAGIQGKFPLAPDINRDGLKVAEGVGASAWFPRSVSALPEMLGVVEAGQIDISVEGVTVFAGVRNAEAKESVMALSGNIAGDELPIGGVEVIILKAPKLRAAFVGDTVTLSGRLPSTEYREAAESGIRNLLTTAEVENTIEVDEDTWDPRWMGAAGDAIPEFLQIVSDLGGAEVEIDGDNLTVSAKLPSDEMREPIALLFSPVGRAGVKMDLQLEILAQPRLMITHEGGMTKLAGRLDSVQTKRQFTLAVAAAGRSGEVEDEIIIDKEVGQSGWNAMAVDLVMVALTGLKDPSIDMSPGKVRIEGEAASKNARIEWEKRLTERFGDAFEIESAIRIPGEATMVEPRFELAEREGKWALVGMVASAEEKAALFKAVESIKDKEDVIDEVEVTQEVGASPWIGELVPVLSILAKAKDPWVSVFRGTVTVEGEFPDTLGKDLLREAGEKIGGLKFEDWSTIQDPVPSVVIPPPPSGERESEIEGN